MKGGAWTNQRTYVLNWIDSIIQVWNIYSTITMAAKNPESYETQLNMEDELEEYMEQEDIGMPKVEDLLKRAEEVASQRQPLEGSLDEQNPQESRSHKPKQQRRKSSKEKELGSIPEVIKEGSDLTHIPQEELEHMISEVTPMPILTTSSRGRKVATLLSEEGKLEVVETEEEEEVEYEESFASQREAAQLREDIEGLNSKMQGMEDTIKALLREREGLPSHLASIREDVNSQLTLMLDKLNTSLESDLRASTVQAAISSVQSLKEDTADRLTAAASYASANPREDSPIADPNASLKGKRRFRPVK